MLQKTIPPLHTMMYEKLAVSFINCRSVTFRTLINECLPRTSKTFLMIKHSYSVAPRPTFQLKKVYIIISKRLNEVTSPWQLNGTCWRCCVVESFRNKMQITSRSRIHFLTCHLSNEVTSINLATDYWIRLHSSPSFYQQHDRMKCRRQLCLSHARFCIVV